MAPPLCIKPCSRRQLLIHPHQLRHALALAEPVGFPVRSLLVEAVGGHNRFVVALLGAAQLRGHGQVVIEIGQRAIRVLRPCV